MEASRILTHRGYSILKSSLSPSQTETIRSDLTVCPKLNKKFASPAVQAGLTFKLFKESASRWYLPRFYGIQQFGEAESSVLSEGLDISDSAAEFKGTPYDYQVNIMNSFLEAGANGLICVPCGKGKTFMALKIAASLKKRFLVIVDKEFLAYVKPTETAAFRGIDAPMSEPLLSTPVMEFDAYAPLIRISPNW